MTDAETKATTTCPQCGASMPVERYFSSWCETCNWNVLPHATTGTSKLASMYQSAGARMTDALYRDLARSRDLNVRLSPSKVAAYLLATIVHLITIGLIIGGVFLLARGSFLAILAGLVLLGLAWVLRPRLPRATFEEPAERVPTLEAVSRRVAEAIGTRPADEIRITGAFNAGVTEVGWRRRRILFVGLPLFAVLDPQERIGLLGHEYGHYVNGDPLRGFYVGSSIATLIEWHNFIAPRSLEEGAQAYAPGVFMIPFNLALLAISWIPLTLARVMVLLAYRESQRAEYLADGHAASTAGADAVISGWEKSHLAEVADRVSQATTDEHWLNNSLWEELRRRAAELPDRERERSRRAGALLGTRLDATHPPTAWRIALVRSRPSSTAPLRMTNAEAAEMDAEIRSVERRIQNEVIDRHKHSLYY